MKITEAQARILYLDYHCFGNTKGTTPEQMGELTSQYSDRIASWQNSVADDENEYEFDDASYERYKDKGEKLGEKATDGFDGKTNTVAKSGAAALSGVGFAMNVTAIAKASNGIKGVTSGFKKIFSKKSFQKPSGGSNVSGFVYAAALIAIATAVIYWATGPNKKAAKACEDLQNPMMNAQGTLSETQSEMAYMQEELVTLSDEASEYNEEANDEIEDYKTEYDMYMQTLMAIQAKIDSGQPLTKEEKDLYKEVCAFLNETGIMITEKQEDTTDIVGEIYDDMGTYQEGYDYAAETVAEVEGLTEYAAGFDKETQVLCYVEGASQSLNAISGAIAGAQLMGSGFWNWALGIASIAAGVSSGIAAGQQFKLAGTVGNEVQMRKQAQEINAETSDMYDIEIDNYDALMSGVGDLEIELPDDVEPVEESSLPTTNNPEQPKKKQGGQEA